MKGERNLQEAEVEEADDLHSHGREKVKTDEMDGAEDQRERSGDDKSIIQEPDNLSDNTKILHPPHDHQNEDYPVSDENPPSREDLNSFGKEDDRDEENPEMDGSGDQESIQEHGAINEGKEDLNENRIISYVRLPQDYPVSIPSERSELGSSVLNDLYVLSVKPPISLKDSNLHKYKEPTQESAGNEGHDDDEESSERSSPPKNKLNKYQKALFDVEDKQFEVDMLVESVSSACKRFEEVNQKILENKISVRKGEFHIKQHFRDSHLRCIERMYGEYGLEVLKALGNNPTAAVPTMLKRLQQKKEELEQDRKELNKVCPQVYAENHAKSLTHPPS